MAKAFAQNVRQVIRQHHQRSKSVLIDAHQHSGSFTIPQNRIPPDTVTVAFVTMMPDCDSHDE